MKPTEIIGNCHLYLGDCREILPTLAAGAMQCCVTSPPYFGLRDYGVDGQIGLEPTPDEFIAKLVEVFRARVVDVDEKTITVEVTGTPEKIGKFEMVVRPYGIVEMVRTGSVSMARGHEQIPTAPPTLPTRCASRRASSSSTSSTAACCR